MYSMLALVFQVNDDTYNIPFAIASALKNIRGRDFIPLDRVPSTHRRFSR